MADQGGVRWNPETQSWDSGGPSAPYTPPPPPRPGHTPEQGPVPEQEYVPEQGAVPAYVPGPRPRVGRDVVVGAVVAAVLVAGGGSYLLWGRDGQAPDDARPPASASAATPTPDGAPTPTTEEPTPGESSPAPVPEGYQRAEETEFSLAVPEGWERRTQAGKNGVTVYFYESPDGPERIQVFRVSEPGATPMSTLRLAERDLERLPGYQRNALGPFADARGEAAELDYAYDSEEWGMSLRTLDRIVRGSAEGATLWAVLSIGPSDAWPRQQQVADDVTASFTEAP